MTELVRRPLIRRPAEAPPPLSDIEHPKQHAQPDAPDRRWALYEEFKLRIRIDRNHLDDAVEEQAQVFLEVCDHHSEALSVRDAAKAALARSDAELARTLRYPAGPTGKRVADQELNDTILIHPTHIEKDKEYQDAKALSDRWGNLRDAFDQRMRMIRELVTLYVQGYYVTGVVGPRNAKRDADADYARQAQADARKQRQ